MSFNDFSDLQKANRSVDGFDRQVDSDISEIREKQRVLNIYFRKLTPDEFLNLLFVRVLRNWNQSGRST